MSIVAVNIAAHSVGPAALCAATLDVVVTCHLCSDRDGISLAEACLKAIARCKSGLKCPRKATINVKGGD